MENGMIFGIRAVIEAIEAGKEIDRLLIKHDLQGDLSRELFQTIRGREIPVQRVPLEKLNHITRKNHQGVIAYVAEVTYHHIEDLVPFIFEQGRNPFFVLLDGITDVRNFGAIGRTALCAGVDAIIIPRHNSVTVTADAIKTSAGALHTLPVCREADISRTLRYLKECGIRIVGATEKGDKDYTKGDFEGPVCLVMGAEDKGIPTSHLALCDEWLRIPIIGNIESLNVSVASGIMIYEILRHRMQ